MIFSSVSVLRSWRVPLCGLVIAGVLFGVPFTSSPGSQCYAKGKGGGGHHAKGAKGGHKARNKRHGPKRQHAQHHSAKNHRNAKRHAQALHKSHGASSHSSHGGSSAIAHGGSSASSHGGSSSIAHGGSTTITHGGSNVSSHLHGGWHDYGWHDSYSNAEIVESEVVTPTIIAENPYIVKFFTSSSGKQRVEEIRASSKEKAKEKILKKHSDAVFTSVELK